MSWIRCAFAAVTVCGASACLADSGIYARLDADGGIHLSNVPTDERFRLLIPPPAAADDGSGLPPVMPGSRQRYDAVIAEAAGRAGIDPALLHAVIAIESAYDARAVSERGAAGLMQLMPETARQFGVADVFDPADNVRGGARYLAELLKRFEYDLRLALAAYNAGEAAVLKYGKRVPPYRETSAYVPKVIAKYRKLRWSM